MQFFIIISILLCFRLGVGDAQYSRNNDIKKGKKVFLTNTKIKFYAYKININKARKVAGLAKKIY